MEKVQNFGAFAAQFLEILQNGLDKRRFVDVTSHATPNSEFSVEHGLAYVPSGRIIIDQDKAGSVYKGTTAWDESKIYLKCDIASVALRLMIF